MSDSLKEVVTSLKPDKSSLLPCPFCGGEAEYGLTMAGEEAYCKKCHAAMPRLTTKAEAIAAWNSRAGRTCHDVKPSLPFFKCDSCGMEDMGGTELWIQDGFYRSQKPNYCPNCGAKVVGE